MGQERKDTIVNISSNRHEKISRGVSFWYPQKKSRFGQGTKYDQEVLLLIPPSMKITPIHSQSLPGPYSIHAFPRLLLKQSISSNHYQRLGVGEFCLGLCSYKIAEAIRNISYKHQDQTSQELQCWIQGTSRNSAQEYGIQIFTSALP